jgi:hypothetical protein
MRTDTGPRVVCQEQTWSLEQRHSQSITSLPNTLQTIYRRHEHVLKQRTDTNDMLFKFTTHARWTCNY